MAPLFFEGHVVAGRYRVAEVLGVGEAAEAYRAEDLSLHRTVVVKALVPEVASHEAVRREFRDRIVRASTLSHPHIPRVYDGGQEHGTIFVVSEYLPGGTLEDRLARGIRLSVDEGARLGRDVAGALAYLHDHGFVLGDLSPASLHFDGEDRVKVGDVTLARLVEPYRERLEVEVARYLSPEQVLGDPATAASDVYALALILFESVTGEPAFGGAVSDTVARARLAQPLPVRLELGTLDMILAQATVPDPLLRLDAEQFAQRLGAVAGDATPSAVPRAVARPLLAQVEAAAPRRTIGFSAPSPDEVSAHPVAPGPSLRPRRALEPPVPGRVASGRTPHFERGFEPPRPPAARARWGYLASAIVLLVVAIGAGAAWKLGLFTSSYTVPNVVGQSLTQAANATGPLHFTVSVTGRTHSNAVAKGDIVSQSPKAGVSAKSGSTISVVVSEGATTVVLPTNLVGRGCAGATNELRSLHVTATCPPGDEIYSATVTAGDVARVRYQGTANPPAVPTGAAVVLELSKGPNPATTTTTTTTTLANQGPRAVPNVVGDTYAQTVAAFTKAVLYFSTTGHLAGTTRWTQVVSEHPAAGTMVPYKSTVTLVVK
jgi:eukaryotic-like serine/threonine-protein kinase